MRYDTIYTIHIHVKGNCCIVHRHIWLTSELYWLWKLSAISIQINGWTYGCTCVLLVITHNEEENIQTHTHTHTHTYKRA